MRLITLKIEPEEFEETLFALAQAQRALMEASMTALTAHETFNNQRARRRLCRMYWEITHQRPTAADEEELTTLARCQVLLSLFARRLFGQDRRNVEAMAKRLARQMERRGYEEFGEED